MEKREFYIGAKKSAIDRDFRLAGNASFENYAKQERDVLRARARWLHENNALMSNIDETILNNVIGDGLKLQCRTESNRANKEIETKFNDWIIECDISRQLNFYDLQRIILLNRFVDGEIFIYKRIVNDNLNPLQLQLIEADRVAKTQGEGGFDIDDYGRVTNWYFQKENSFDIYKVDAKDIINYFKKERPSQYRGVSEYKQAILDLKNFMAFNSATIESVRARANIAYIVESDLPPDELGLTDQEKRDIQIINGVSVHYLNPGEKIEKLDPDLVSAEYKSFVETIVRMLANARNISYELAFRDFSKVNFSSARASIIQDNKRFSREQNHLIYSVLDPIYKAWLEANIMSGNIKSVSYSKYIKDPSRFLKHVWIRPAREWVNPLQDINAAEKELKMGLTTRTDLAAERGREFEDVIKKQAEEQQLMEKYNLKGE